MNNNRFVRFQDWNSEKSFSSEQQYSVRDGFYARKARPAARAVWNTIRRGWEIGSEKIGCLKTPLRFGSKVTTLPGKDSKESKELKELEARRNILDPQGLVLQRWNKIFVIACVIAVSVDPLFFYIPVVDADEGCLDLDKNLEIIACVLRTFIDIFYILRIILQFRTGFIAPNSRVFGRGELVEDPWIIAKRYLTSYFIIDILAILPLPQMSVLMIIPSLKGPVSLTAKNLLKYVVLSQYVPRVVRIYPLFKEVTSSSGILTETAWAGAAFNLCLYMLASHIIGAYWYLFSIEQEDKCWIKVCHKEKCRSEFLYCGNHREQKYQYKDKCPFIPPDEIKNDSVFNFGIFIDALDSGIVESRDFLPKFFYCFWWGLRNLSSLGQNLKTSTYVGEILFAVFIAIGGLVLFSLLIGNMQKYLQSTTVRIEEMRVKRRDAEQWMSHRMLPDNLKERIRKYEQYKWQETRGVEERSLIHSLPRDLRRDINRHLCFDLLMKVPMFQKVDEQTLDAICDRLRPALYTKDSFIVREGDTVEEMLFIMRGNLKSVTTNGGRTGFFNVAYLKAGDFCGEGLLTWALDPHSSHLPISTRTVQVLTEVEAFALVSDDLKSVTSQFQRLHHKDIQHIFRYYSVQWQTWAACFIQAAWRRHCKRKLAKSLRQEEERLQDALANEAGSSPSLGVTIYASRFAANALRTLRQHGARPPPKLPNKSLMPQKPSEPDFSTPLKQ